MDSKIYECIIVGTGPAGYTASIYLSRYKISNMIIGKQPGGTITLAHKVENFPGFESIPGTELAQKMADQAKNLGAEIITESVARVESVTGITSTKSTTGITSKDETITFKITTETNKEFYTKSLIIATGTDRRKLNIPGEDEYLGRGISYCTNCDAPFFKGKTVVVIGGSDAAVSGAIHLTGYADKIYLIYRGEQLRAEPIWTDQLASNPKIVVIYKTNIIKVMGDGNKVSGVELDNPFLGNSQLPTDGVFIECGGVPACSFLTPLKVNMDESGFVIVNDGMETNVEGVFAAGDNTTHSLIMAQAITACAQGAVASSGVFKYLKGQKAPQQLGI